MKRNNKFYCYNKEQAKFLINCGCELLDIGIHKKTKNTFYVFKRSEFKKYFDDWCKRQH